VEVDGLVSAGRDLVDIEIEGAGGGYDEAGDAGFLEGFAPSDAEDVRVAIAMAAELEPAVELAMVVKEGAAAIGIYDEGAAGEVGGEGGAEEAIRGAVQEREHAVADGDFPGAGGEIEGEKLAAEGGAG
jgi:hypothetical protein